MQFDLAKLDRQIIAPDSQEHWLSLRIHDITSTESPALFGLSPYTTEFELWHRKRDQAENALEMDERMRWGLRLQDAIAQGVGDDHNLEVRPLRDYMRLPNLRIGSSFDYYIIDLAADRMRWPGGRKILEVKNVDRFAFREGWIEDENGLAAPAHIELQVQHQMLVSGIHSAIIAAFVGGNHIELLHREYDPDVGRGILAACADFWASIDANKAPTPDYQRDLGAIKNVYGYAEPGKILTDPENPRILELIAESHAASRREAAARLDKETAQAELLTLIGDAERVTAGGFKVFAGTQPPAEIPAYTRKGFRSIRITPPKSA